VDEKIQMDSIQRAILLNIIEMFDDGQVDDLIKTHFGDV